MFFLSLIDRVHKSMNVVMIPESHYRFPCRSSKNTLCKKNICMKVDFEHISDYLMSMKNSPMSNNNFFSKSIWLALVNFSLTAFLFRLGYWIQSLSTDSRTHFIWPSLAVQMFLTSKLFLLNIYDLHGTNTNNTIHPCMQPHKTNFYDRCKTMWVTVSESFLHSQAF